MTRKSQSRLERDEAEATQQNNNSAQKIDCWKQLRQMHIDCATLLISYTGLKELMGRRDIVAEITDKQTYATNANMFTRDMLKFTQDLVAIQARYSDKTGDESNDPNDVALSCFLGEEYEKWMANHDIVIFPVVAHLHEQLTEAEQILAKKVIAYAKTVVEREQQAQFDKENNISSVDFTDTTPQV